MIDPRWCRDLNERRQALAVSTLADESVPVGGGVMAHTAGAPWICKAVALELESDLAPHDLERVCVWFRERGVAPTVELTSLSSEASLRVAAEAGFGLVEVENVLATQPHAPEVEPPQGVVLRHVDPGDAASVRRFAEIVSSGFVPAGETPPEPVIESGVRSVHQPAFVAVLACDASGEPIAAAGTEIVELEHGSGGAADTLLALCGTTVLPPFRRRGIQQALMAERLRLGVARGATLALVESKPGIPTERNAARLGFSLRYTRLVLRAPLGA